MLPKKRIIEIEKDFQKLQKVNWVKVGYEMALKDITKIISNWKDTSIKSKENPKLALMITNGGYIHKPSLLKELEVK